MYFIMFGIFSVLVGSTIAVLPWMVDIKYYEVSVLVLLIVGVVLCIYGSYRAFKVGK